MDKTKKPEDSHILMPKFMLKHFEVNNKYCYYDVKGNFIGTKGHAVSTNTEKGYYSSDMEDDLNTLIETPFSRLLYSIYNNIHSEKTFVLTDEDILVLKNFAIATVARSPVLHETFMKQPFYHAQFFMNIHDAQFMHDQAVRSGMYTVINNGYLDNYIITFLENRTDVPFVLPVRGLYSFLEIGKPILLLPLDPHTALMYIHKDLADRVINQDGQQYKFYVDNEEQIFRYNLSAVIAQCRDKKGRVVSADKALLERLKVEYHILMDEYNKNKPEGVE